MSESASRLRIHAITHGGADVLLFDLRSPTGETLAPFTPGAHIDLRLDDGMVRSYSLLNDSRDRHRYVIAVKHEATSRGGSRWMHGSAKVGTLVDVVAPQNAFHLDEAAPCSVLIAGGIGITPLWSMVQRLSHLGKPWQLHYRTRSKAATPLLAELSEPAFLAHMKLSFSDDPNSGRLELQAIVADAPAGSHYYCCGPQKMIDAFEVACVGLEPERVHLERFSSTEAPATEGGYTVTLAKSAREVPIPAGKTILEMLSSLGVAVPSSCQQGVCGSCETRVLAGTPDHRDLVLSESEKASGQMMMICCSGSLSERLVLDL